MVGKGRQGGSLNRLESCSRADSSAWHTSASQAALFSSVRRFLSLFREDSFVSNPVPGTPQIDWSNVQLDVRQPPGNGPDFFHALEGAMDKVQEVQSGADQQVANLLQGNGQDLHSAMMAVEKADLSFQLMMQVRNKIVQAYQTISQMQF
jgi:flagellar hook-basal body complex protein FliE